MYELVLLVHVYLYLDNRVLLDIIGMFPYILLYCYPYVIPTIHVVIIHRLFFVGWFIGYVALDRQFFFII